MKEIFDFTIQWHITSKCVNRCKHCYMFDADYKRKLCNELSYGELLDALGNIEKFESTYNVSIPSYIVTGGDPFSREDIYDFLTELQKRNKKIIVLGIPERVTEKNIEKMYAHGVSIYQVSLDGMEKTHDAVRGKGSFDNTIKALQLLSDSAIAGTVMLTLCPDNAPDMFEVIDYLDMLDINASFAFDFMVFEGNAEKFKNQLFTPEQTKEILYRYEEKTKDFKKKKSKIVLEKKVKLFNAIKNADDLHLSQSKQQYSICGGCYNGFSSLSIDSDGEVYSCRRLPISIGNIKTDTFESLLLENTLQRRFRRKLSFPECGKCKHFKVCRGCPAYSFSVFRNPFKKPSFCFLETSEESLECEPNMNISNKEEFNLLMRTKSNVELSKHQKLLLSSKKDLLHEVAKHLVTEQ